VSADRSNHLHQGVIFAQRRQQSAATLHQEAVA
jgi:hypothetical protein